MYRIGICDDDKVLCADLEEQIYEISKELALKVEIDVWYSGESVQNDLQKGIELELLFLDIELIQNNGIAVGNFIRNELEDMQTHIVYISSKESYAMQLFKVQPLDFLIKPVSVEQLKEVLMRSVKQKSRPDAYFEYQKGNSVFRIPIELIDVEIPDLAEHDYITMPYVENSVLKVSLRLERADLLMRLNI